MIAISGGVEASELRAEITRLRAGEADALPDPGTWPTPAQWIRMWNDATAEQRTEWAQRILGDSERASRCFLQNHEWQIENLQGELRRAQETHT